MDKMTDNKRFSAFVLASQSAVRARLLHNAGLRIEVSPALVDELGLIAANAGESPDNVAAILAKAKAETLARKRPDALVIGADQLLVLHGEILQKPESLDGAHKRLAVLSGCSHQLITAVVLAVGDSILWSHVESATLTMHVLSEAEIARHLAEDGAASLQSVGAYRLEGPGIRLFAALEGDYFAMLGLPVVPLLSALRRLAPEFLPGAALS